MEPDFWHQRWQDNLIGFHQAEINAHMREYWARLKVPVGSQVFVPLCGKSLDILWLREQGYQVVGVEISRIAVNAFFNENSLSPTKATREGFDVYQAPGITIYCGDFFALSAVQLADIRCVFDRAALIALPRAMRERYVGHLLSLLDRKVPLLLITLEYPQAQMPGPPFSVSGEEVESLYRGKRRVERLLEIDKLADEPRFAEQGLTELREKVYILT